MQRESLLLAAACAVVLASGAAVMLVPGAVAEQDADIRPSDLDLRETTITPASVGGESATLQVTTFLEHRGGPAENVTVHVRATDTESGIVETTATTDVGRIDESGEHVVRTNVTVERAGGYSIETLVYEDGKRLTVGETDVRGLRALTPEYARTVFEFRDAGDGLPPVTFSIENVAEGDARLSVSAALTNTGAETVEDLELVVLAQQADSNIVADRARTDIGSVRSGRTVSPNVELTVPDEYNYRLYAILKRDGVELTTARTEALLNPERPVPENVTTEEVTLETGAFEQGDETGAAANTPTPVDAGGGASPSATPGGGGSGLGVVTAVLAVVLVAVGRNWRRQQ